MIDWKIRIGRFLFKHRSFTPLPLIVAVFLLFKPLEPGARSVWVTVAGIVISVLGELLRIVAVGYSYTGASGREVYLRADSINTTGIYSITRNPLYIGNFFIFTGLLVVFANVWGVLLFGFFLILQYYFIILAEEDYLQDNYGSEYDAYRNTVRRILPTLKGYKKNRNPFSPRRIFFKENDSIFNMLMMLLLVLAYKEKLLNGQIGNPRLYIISGVVLLVLYIVVKIVKKSKRITDPT